MSGWLAGWLGGWLDGLLDGCLDEWVSRWMAWLGGWLDGWVAGIPRLRTWPGPGATNASPLPPGYGGREHTMLRRTITQSVRPTRSARDPY